MKMMKQGHIFLYERNQIQLHKPGHNDSKSPVVSIILFVYIALQGELFNIWDNKPTIEKGRLYFIYLSPGSDS